MTTDNKNI